MDVHEHIQKLQSIEETLQTYLVQKQQVQGQALELESAAEALENASSSFRIIGNIMVERPAEELRKETLEQLEKVRVRLSALEKQEKRLKEQAERLQREVMESLNQEGKHGDAQ